MSEVSMNRLMLDLQRLAAQAQVKQSQGVDTSDAAAGPDGFGSLLKKAIDDVNNAQKTADTLKKAFEVGEPGVDLPQVMVATQKAGIAFEAMLEVRKHLLKAYQDVMSMQV